MLRTMQGYAYVDMYAGSIEIFGTDSPFDLRNTWVGWSEERYGFAIAGHWIRQCGWNTEAGQLTRVEDGNYVIWPLTKVSV